MTFLEIAKLLVENLGKKRTLRIFAIALFAIILFVVLTELDIIWWTWWWLVPVFIALYFGVEVLITTFSMTNDDEKTDKKIKTGGSRATKKKNQT